MPDLIPIPGFSPEDIKRKARSALSKLKDNYHLVSPTEASRVPVEPVKKTKIVSSFIKHINELHTVEVSADNWNSELTTLSLSHNYPSHCFVEKSLGYNIKCNFHVDAEIFKNGIVQIADITEQVPLRVTCYEYEEVEQKICPMEELEKAVIEEQRLFQLQLDAALRLALSSGIPARIQHYDRELDSADHGENTGVKTAG